MYMHLIITAALSLLLIITGRKEINRNLRPDMGILIITIAVLYFFISAFQDIRHVEQVSSLTHKEINPWDYSVNVTPADTITYTPDYYDPWEELDEALAAPQIY